MSRRQRLAILVRCDASAAIGSGHLTRCRSLARALADLDVAVAFALRAENPGSAALVHEDGFPRHEIPVESPLGEGDLAATLEAAATEGATCVLVDHYEAESWYLDEIEAAGLLLAVVDDRADRDLTAADWLLNQNLAAPELDYRAAPSCERLLGLEYALLRPEFAAARGTLERTFSSADANVLVTFGGGDTVEFASTVVSALDRLDRKLHIRVVVGADAPGADGLREQAATARQTVEVLRDVRDMAGQMAWADLSVNAGGSTCWELMCLGVPMLVTSISPDQRLNPVPLSRAGVAVTLDSGDLSQIEAAVEALLDDPTRRREMSERGRELVDGAGAARAARSLAELLARERSHAFD